MKFQMNLKDLMQQKHHAFLQVIRIRILIISDFIKLMLLEHSLQLLIGVSPCMKEKANRIKELDKTNNLQVGPEKLSVTEILVKL